MTCPNCATELPEPVTANIVICPKCLRSLIIFESEPRITTSADTTSLSDVDLKKLREARKKLRNA